MTSTLRRPAVAALVMFGLLPYVSTIKWPPIPSFWAEWICALLAVAVAITLRLGRERDGVATEPASIPLAALACLGGALVVLLQLVAHQPRYTGAAWLAVAELSLAAFVCVSAAGLKVRGSIAEALDAWAFGLLLALMLNGAEVLVERSGWQIYIDTFIPRVTAGRTVGLFGQQNQLAVFTVLGWSAAQFLWLRGRLNAVVYLGIAAVVGLITAGAASRAGTVLLVAAVLLCWLALRAHERRREGQWLLLVAVALFVLMELAWTLTTPTLNLNTTVLRTDTSSRTEMLRHAFELTLMHPLTGVGFGNFSAARWTELTGPLMHPNSANAHNIVAQLAAELGVLGAAVILVPLGWCVFACLRAASRRIVSPEKFFVSTVVLVIAGYSLLEYPLWYTFFLLPFAFLLGLVEQPSLKLRPMQSEPMNVLSIGAGLLALVVWVALGIDYRRSEALYTDAVVGELNETRGPTAMVVPSKAAREISLFTAFDTYADLMLSRTLLLNGRLMADKIPITERAMLAFPNWETVSRHIAFLVADGKDEEARAVWDQTARNRLLRTETYEALQRNAASSPRLAEFFAKLAPPAVAAVAQP